MFNTLGNQLARTIDANADILMAGGALFGLGTTVVLAIKATPNAEDIIYEAREAIEGAKQEAIEKGWPNQLVELTIYEIQLDCLKRLIFNYSFAMASGLATGGLIIGTLKKGRANTAAATTMLNATNLMYQEYRGHVKEEIGERKEQIVYDKIREKHLAQSDTPPRPTIYNTGNGDTLCYVEMIPGDKATGLYFWSSPEAVHAAYNDLNNIREDYGSASFADFLFCLNIELRPKHCNKIGWREHIETRDTSHIHKTLRYPVLDISFYNPPKVL